MMETTLKPARYIDGQIEFVGEVEDSEMATPAPSEQQFHERGIT